MMGIGEAHSPAVSVVFIRHVDNESFLNRRRGWQRPCLGTYGVRLCILLTAPEGSSCRQVRSQLQCRF